MTVSNNLQEIMANVYSACNRVGRNQQEVKIIAVTKYVTIDRAKEAIEAGIIHLGENRSEGLIEKKGVLQDRGVWHFIGTLQTKKVKKIIGLVDYIHSLDRLSLAEEIQKRAIENMAVKCFVQVNVSQEASKAGLSQEEVIPFIKRLADYSAIQVVGLMTMAPNTADPEETRPVFKELKKLQEEVQAYQFPHAPCTELSMGMSNDYSIAVEEGATFIRLGTSLVGEEL